MSDFVDLDKELAKVPRLTADGKNKVIDKTDKTDMISFFALIIVPAIYSLIYSDPGLIIITGVAASMWLTMDFFRMKAITGHILYLREKIKFLNKNDDEVEE